MALGLRCPLSSGARRLSAAGYATSVLTRPVDGDAKRTRALGPQSADSVEKLRQTLSAQCRIVEPYTCTFFWILEPYTYTFFCAWNVRRELILRAADAARVFNKICHEQISAGSGSKHVWRRPAAVGRARPTPERSSARILAPHARDRARQGT